MNRCDLIFTAFPGGECIASKQNAGCVARVSSRILLEWNPPRSGDGELILQLMDLLHNRIEVRENKIVMCLTIPGR